MEYMSYGAWIDPKDGESARRRKIVEHALIELGFAVQRLNHITDKLSEVDADELTEENISRAVSELDYHGEYFLATTYEIRDRLIGLLAVLSARTKDKLTKRTSTGESAFRAVRIPIYINELPVAVSTKFRLIESALCPFVHLRGIKTHEAALHFEFLIDGKQYDPEEILRNLGETTFGDVPQAIRSEISRFIEKHKTACKNIDSAIDELDDAVRQTENLDG